MMTGRGKMRIAAVAAAALACSGVAQARAQAGCAAAGANTADCERVESALVAAVPQVGIAAAAGNPLLGTASVGGVRLGFLPRVTAGIRVNAARMRLPDILNGGGPPPGTFADGDQTQTVAVVGADAAVSLFEGVTRGTAGGIGALDVLLSAGVLPATGAITDVTGTWGAGVRVGLLRETFGTPGVSVSTMYRRTGGVHYGISCGNAPCAQVTAAGLDFDVRDWSTRLTAAKRVGPLGLLAGVGYDRFSDPDGRFVYRNSTTTVSDTVKLKAGRWSAFANAAYALTVGSVIVEGGWMGGHGGDSGDSGPGAPFGSIGVRLSL